MAYPNTINQLYPIAKFYVAFGDAEQGSIINYSTVSAIAGVYDFSPGSSGAGKVYGEITVDDHGVFSAATYSNSPPTSYFIPDLTGVEVIVVLAAPLQASSAATKMCSYLTSQLKPARLTNLTWKIPFCTLSLSFSQNDGEYSDLTDLTTQIDQDLHNLVKSGILPSTETWTISSQTQAQLKAKLSCRVSVIGWRKNLTSVTERFRSVYQENYVQEAGKGTVID